MRGMRGLGGQRQLTLLVKRIISGFWSGLYGKSCHSFLISRTKGRIRKVISPHFH